jgi:hypothetical protein
MQRGRLRIAVAVGPHRGGGPPCAEERVVGSGAPLVSMRTTLPSCEVERLGLGGERTALAQRDEQRTVAGEHEPAAVVP